MPADSTTDKQQTYSNAYQDPALVERYESFIYRKGGYDDVIWRVEQTHFKRLLDRHYPEHAKADALDFACGSGRILVFLREHVGTLVGVDISPEMLARAKQKAPDVPLICANIVENPQDVPGDKDIVTSFRFLLLSEPPLREACIRQLVQKMRPGGNSIMILNTHGNPWSFRALAALRNRLFRPRTTKLAKFSLADMKRLADRVGLRLVGTAGLGFLPSFVYKILPTRWCERLERLLADRPILWRLGTHIFFVLKKA